MRRPRLHPAALCLSAGASIALLAGLGFAAPAPAGTTAEWSYPEAPTWAFRPVKRPTVPNISASRRPRSSARSKGQPSLTARTAVDAFIQQKLAANGLAHAPPADRRTLIRRATFDLHGLPPSPEEVEAFLRDPAPTPGAFAKVVDRLLASPRYGERWGRHWLDVVRYADTGGGSNDFERPNAWRYRDYVIRSLNQDKPYDRFVLEQIAGDELDPQNPEALVANGFLRTGPWEHTGMSVEPVTRQQWLDDVTNDTAITFLGLTAGCARCHDHKFDPIPTKDYYRLQAVFAGTRFAERPAGWLAGENRQHFERDAARIRARLAALDGRLKELQEKMRLAGLPARGRAGEPAAEALPDAARNLPGLDFADFERERIYRKWTQLYTAMLPRYEPLAFTVTNDTSTPPDAFILAGGQLTAPGEKVAPGVFSAVCRLGDLPEPAFPPAAAGRRLALARWIVDPQNPLTARVMVNRVWQSHFGRGLVETSNNFGKMGKRPSHPELLDWLAAEFSGAERSGGVMEYGSSGSGVRKPITPLLHHSTTPSVPNTPILPYSTTPWSLKSLHRLIMNLAVYQQASGAPPKADPEGRLLATFPPRRLEAKEIRDAVLAVTGELSGEEGGPGTFPEINEDLATQPRHVMGTIAPAWEPSPTRAERNRRTIYTYQQRSMINPLVEVFNGANPNDSCERRDASTVAPQVFNLFNSRFSHDMALAFARRVEREVADRPGQVRLAFRLAFQREPTAAELRAAQAHLTGMDRRHAELTPEPPAPASRRVRSAIVEQTGERVQIEEEAALAGYERNLHPSEVGPSTRALAELCLVLLNANEFAYVY